jgi:hypothetical protein
VADDGGDDGVDEGLVQTVASWTADLDRAATVADITWG